MSRFNSTLEVDKNSAKFVEVEEIDWDYHLTRVFEGEKPSSEDMLTFLEDIFSYGLDIKKPLWRCIVFPEMDDGSCNIVMVFNHAVGDGVSSIGVLLKIVDDSPIDPTLPMNKQKVKKGDEKALVKKRNKGPTMSTWNKVSAFFSGLKSALFVVNDPPDEDNVFRLKNNFNIYDEDNKYTGRKLFGRAEDIPLDEVKALKNKFEGATINDIFIALMTISIRNFLEEVEDPVLKDKKGIRGNFPVSLRTQDDPLLKDNNPNNNTQLYAFRFPMDYESPVDCVWKVKEIIDASKVSPELPLTHAIGKFMMNNFDRNTILPLIQTSGTKASMMLSNVPGPQRTVHIAGQAVKNLSFYLVSPIGTYLGVLSYNGWVTLTANFDESLEIDPKDFLKHWNMAYDQLKVEVESYEGTIPASKAEREKLKATEV